MAYAAAGAICPWGVSAGRNRNSSEVWALDCGTFLWHSQGVRISHSPCLRRLSWNRNISVSSLAGLGYKKGTVWSTRRKEFCYFAGCVYLYHVAHSQVSETQKRKVHRDGVKKGRSKIRVDDDSEIGPSSPNGFSHPDASLDGRKTIEAQENGVSRRLGKKTKKANIKESEQAAGSRSTIPQPKLVSKNVDGNEAKKAEDLLTDENDLDEDQTNTPEKDKTEFDAEIPGRVENGGRAVDSDDDFGVNGAPGGGTEMSMALEDLKKHNMVVGQERNLRLLFMESIMERARSGDVEGVEEAISEMEISGIQAGPRAHHGLIVSYTRALDAERAVQALRKELASVERPLPETFVAMARMFGRLGQADRGQETLAAMEKLEQNPRYAWLILIEELQKAGHLQEANDVFFKGADGGLRAVPQLYDTLIEENAKAGDHGSAIDIMRSLEYAGYQPTTFHHNCLLMCQANANVAEVAASTFEEMQYGPDESKPDTESYNWVLQAHIRHNEGDRLQEVVDLVGEMVEDHDRVQPNMRTYSLLVECFTKYNVPAEAVRHFRALSRIPQGMQSLHNVGKHGDPLSLYLRSMCLEGRAVDLLEALEAMVRDKQEIPSRAMLVNQKGRTLVSSWIEPIGAEADLGYEVDYVARYVAEGGASGTRKRWSEKGRRSEDSEGFRFSAPVETSFRQHCVQARRRYVLKLMRKLRNEGVLALGPGATEETVVKVMAKLRKETVGEMTFHPRKPKAASKMVVSELKQELEAQGLPTDGTRPVLYQRVQKARRINRARGRPLWVPEAEEEAEKEAEDHSVDVFMERLNLKNDHTEFWRKRLAGEDQDLELFQLTENQINGVLSDEVESDFGEEDDDDNEDEVEEETEDTEDLAAEDGGEEEEADAPELLALKLLRKKPEVAAAAEEKVLSDEEIAGQWSGLTFQQKIAKLRAERILDPSEIYTIDDVWLWSWEREIRAAEPDPWTQEREVQIGIQIMQRVLELGGSPTVGDCAMLVHAAMRIPWSEGILSLIKQTHRLGFKFGSKLYDDVLNRLITIGKKDASMSVISNMEEVGITAPRELIETTIIKSVEMDRQEVS